MKKRYSIKFWIIFWLIAIIFLVSWFLFLEYKNKNYMGVISFVSPIIKVLPMKSVQKKELTGTLDIIGELSNKKKSTFLLLFQNKDELRPGGGYIGSFGILKMEKGRIVFIDIHDTNVFGSRIATQVDPPKPMQDWLGVKNLKLRDSNWSPDFKINAKQADYFYHLEGGQEELDGVIALSNKLLPSFLEIVGPVEIEGYPRVYTSENAVSQLEYQIEKGYYEQGIEKGKRKYIMKEMSKSVIKKAQALNWSQKKELIKKVEQHLNEKDVLIYFKDKNLQRKIKDLGWSGELKDFKKGDFLMMVDANLGARKSDAVMGREFEYVVDFRRKRPTAKLKIKYTHKGKVRDLLTEDYRTYLRILTPSKSWLYDTGGLDDLSFVDFDNILNVKSFGIFHKVNLGKSKTVEFDYYLPEEFKFEDYELFIQKQTGIDRLIGKVKLIDKMGMTKSYTVNSSKDIKIKINLKKQKKETAYAIGSIEEVAFID
jgi:hypothetical protein